MTAYDTYSALLGAARNTPNPFRVGDKVRAVNLVLDDDLTYGEVYTVAKVRERLVNIEGKSIGGFLHTRFEAAVEPETPKSFEAPEDSIILRAHAEELLRAVQAGEINNFYSALGFLGNFLIDWQEESEED